MKADGTKNCDILHTTDSNGKSGWAAGCNLCEAWVSPGVRLTPTDALQDAMNHEGLHD